MKSMGSAIRKLEGRSLRAWKVAREAKKGRREGKKNAGRERKTGLGKKENSKKH